MISRQYSRPDHKNRSNQPTGNPVSTTAYRARETKMIAYETVEHWDQEIIKVLQIKFPTGLTDLEIEDGMLPLSSRYLHISCCSTSTIPALLQRALIFGCFVASRRAKTCCFGVLNLFKTASTIFLTDLRLARLLVSADDCSLPFFFMSKQSSSISISSWSGGRVHRV